MVLAEQLSRGRAVDEPASGDRAAGERAARESLRRQVARLERELSGIVADGFPNIAAAAPAAPTSFSATSSAGGPAPAGPRLLNLGELERQRDALALRVRAAQHRAAERAEYERRARALLARMRLEPGRYKFTRLRVADLGEGGCGTWEVRPRLGLVGMLAGWWELKLSSGCPLA